VSTSRAVAASSKGSSPLGGSVASVGVGDGESVGSGVGLAVAVAVAVAPGDAVGCEVVETVVVQAEIRMARQRAATTRTRRA
jgi:hypothetical protein